jgi:sulfatase modifying factor 1
VNWLNTSTGSVPAYKFDSGGSFQLWQPLDPGYDASNLYRNSLTNYFLPSENEWHKAAYYNPIAGIYYDYPTGSDAVPDGIDSLGDPNFEAVFFDGAVNPGPNIVSNVGLLSSYGIAGQAGNVAEWVETAVNFTNDIPTESRIFRGGSWGDGPNLLAAWNVNGIDPSNRAFYRGFRVATNVPEPAFIQMAGAALSVFLAIEEIKGVRTI